MDLTTDIYLYDLPYYASLDLSLILSKFQTVPHGLTQIEAEIRINTFGKNIIHEEKNIHILLQFISAFKNPIILILLVVAGISFMLGETINALIVTCMIFLSTSLNFVQEYKADQSAKKLKTLVATKANVLRNNTNVEVKTEDICPGDIIILNAGDLIPADGRVITARDFFVNQALLTGEAFPVEKTENISVNSSIDNTNIPNIVYAGTHVITGTATVLAIFTGPHSHFGKLSHALTEKPMDNEFTRGIHSFSYLILRIVFTFVLFIFLFNALLKHDVLDAFTFSIAIAVGLTPEFLPMIMSVTMGKGSTRMAKLGVIVKKLHAIPSLGSMDILCTDKTGTLTEASIKLIKYIDILGNNSEDTLRYTYLNSYFQTGISNPMDDAVLSFKKIDMSQFRKIDEIPYDFSRKKISIVIQENQARYLITKGAPEEIVTICTHYKNASIIEPLDESIKQKIFTLYHSLSREGYRVLAVAQKTLEGVKPIYTKNDETDLTFVGFTAFLDPAKPDAKEAIDELEDMGIEMKVISGDNELVTQKICQDIGITIKGMLLGSEITTVSDEALSQKVENVTIFARCSPQDKKRIIEMLIRNGHVVGYMGDGINDATSLQAADVGISVDNAVDVAKEAADIILTHKSLHELKNGVIEGRITFGNTMKYILMGLSSNFGNMFSVLGAVLFLPFLPMLPIQILLNNFLYDLSQITIPSDTVDPEYIQKPKRWNISFIKNFMFIFGPISSLFDFTTFFVLYGLFRSNPAGFQTGWFMESLATQTLVIHIIRTKFTPILKSTASSVLWISTTFVVVIGWIIPYTAIGKYFHFIPLPVPIILILGGIVFLYLILTEVGKQFYYRRFS